VRSVGTVGGRVHRVLHRATDRRPHWLCYIRRRLWSRSAVDNVAIVDHFTRWSRQANPNMILESRKTTVQVKGRLERENQPRTNQPVPTVKRLSLKSHRHHRCRYLKCSPSHLRQLWHVCWLFIARNQYSLAVVLCWFPAHFWLPDLFLPILSDLQLLCIIYFLPNYQSLWIIFIYLVPHRAPWLWYGLGFFVDFDVM